MPARVWVLSPVVAAAFWLSWIGERRARGEDADPRLAVVSDALVSVVVRSPFGDLTLERADLASGRARPVSPVGEVQEFRRTLTHPPRWRIGHGFYWGVVLHDNGGRGGFRPGFRRFQPPSAGIVRIPLSDFRPLAGPADALAVPDANTAPTEITTAEPLATAMTVAWLARSGAVQYDLVPIGTHACRLYFILDGQLETWDYRFHWERRDGVSGRWNEVSRTPIEWNEPFLALPDGADRLFLATASGHLWLLSTALARRDARPLARIVWSDPARPIRWIVVDAPRSRTFALGPGFSLLVSPDPHPHPLIVPKSSDPVDPLSEALRVARAVLSSP